MRTTTWLILTFICCGLTRSTDGAASHGQSSVEKGTPITPPASLGLSNPRGSDRHGSIQTTGGISLSGSHGSMGQPTARAADGPASQAGRDGDDRPSTQTTNGNSWRSSRGAGLPPGERVPSYNLHGDASGLYMPPIEDISGNNHASPWDKQDTNLQSRRTDAQAGGTGNQDAQYLPPSTRRAEEPDPPNGNTTTPKREASAAQLLGSFQPWITEALALAVVLFPVLLAVRSIRAGHTRRSKIAGRSRRGQHVHSSAPMILTGLLMQKPSSHDEVVNATHQAEPRKTRRAA